MNETLKGTSKVQLAAATTLADLPYFSYQVSPETMAEEVAEQFQRDPELPGVLVVAGDRVIGMISKVKFFERMSQQFGRDLYLPRPIKLMPEIANPKVPPLVLMARTPVEEAVEQALNRPPAFVYEPIVVRTGKQLVLVDMRVVLIAQAQVLSRKNLFIQQQHLHTQQILESLRVEKERNQDYAKRLESELTRTQQMNEALEQQERSVREQAERIAQLNQRFISISQVLSERGQKAFQETFTGVNQITRHTAEVYRLSERLKRDVEIIDQATHQIAEITRQVKNLAVQAGLIASRSGQRTAGFDFITEAINKLANQVVVANQQVEEMANHFRHHIREVVQSTASGEKIARSLLSQVETTQQAIQELQTLLDAEGTAAAETEEEVRATAVVA
ncbi:MAG: hypothetical protein KatS3mg067_0909 [Thermosynechococcus sp.]|uniref:hypothetical protein n=1 Tax=Thermosynechococcus sp. TaxID=2814275 RepID=UPI0022025A62|nr:hypothetical protein [Thermosynechococcus sp.]BCX11971.1 MAG: hypothetical protein KatS3mg067_0909 [Thermosynechococcus sp.]